MIEKHFDELKSSGNLPSPSGVGMQILQLTQSEDYSTEEVGQIIQSDPALTGRILKIANSAQHGSAEGSRTVEEAMMRLGMGVVRNVALGFSLVTANRSGSCQGFDYDGYWSRSLARGVGAQIMADRFGQCVPAEAFICGLLSEVGILALASVHPNKYAEILQSMNAQPSQDLRTLEQSSFDIHHGEVAGWMLGEWGLPSDYCEAMVAMGDYVSGHRQRTSRLSHLVRYLWAAQRIARVCALNENTPHGVVKLAYEDLERVREDLELDTTEFAELAEDIVSAWREWGQTLGIPTNSAVSFQYEGDGGAVEGAQGGSPENSNSEERPDGSAIGKPSDELQILVIESDRELCSAIQSELQAQGHEVQTAHEGKEGLRVALEVVPDIVIAAATLPQMGALELCKTMRRFDAGRKLFFIVMTDDGDEDYIVECAENGMDDYIVKPVNLRLLRARVKSAQRVIALQRNLEAEKQTVHTQLAELGVMTRRLRAASLTDPLTELPNRRYAMKRIEQEWASSKQKGLPLSVIMMDIDKFKSVNDGYGHDTGDVVLKEVAGILKRGTRKGEEPARLGGEEFMIILRECQLEDAVKVAERIRLMSERNRIQVGDFDRCVTMSLGVACSSAGMETFDELIKASDELVYKAKETGRNKVCWDGGESAEDTGRLAG